MKDKGSLQLLLLVLLWWQFSRLPSDTVASKISFTANAVATHFEAAAHLIMGWPLVYLGSSLFREGPGQLS